MRLPEPRTSSLPEPARPFSADVPNDLDRERFGFALGQPGPHLLNGRYGRPMANVRLASKAPGLPVRDCHRAIKVQVCGRDFGGWHPASIFERNRNIKRPASIQLAPGGLARCNGKTADVFGAFRWRPPFCRHKPEPRKPTLQFAHIASSARHKLRLAPGGAATHMSPHVRTLYSALCVARPLRPLQSV